MGLDDHIKGLRFHEDASMADQDTLMGLRCPSCRSEIPSHGCNGQ